MFYVYTLASSLQVTINILSDRVVYINNFAGSIISHYFDQVAVILLTILWILFSVNERRIRLIISLVYGILLISGMSGNISILLSSTALSTIPVAVLLLFMNSNKRITHLKKKTLLNTTFSITVNYLIFIGLLIGIASIIVSIAHILFPSFLSPIDNYSYEISLVLSSSFSPFLLLLLLFCFPVKYLVAYLKKSTRKKKQTFT